MLLTFGNKLLMKILSRCGAYYQSGRWFYHRVWHQHLSNMGFRVTSVTKQPFHQIWEVRCYATLSAQSYLLLSIPAPKPQLLMDPQNLWLKQLCLRVRRIARDLGTEIPRDCILVTRRGNYLRILFLWNRGRPGRWVELKKQLDPFSFVIQLWLHQNRN